MHDFAPRASQRRLPSDCAAPSQVATQIQIQIRHTPASTSIVPPQLIVGVVAEFCEPAEYDMELPDGTSYHPSMQVPGLSRGAAITRVMDRNLCLNPAAYGLPALPPQCAELDEAYGAYAQLASLLYERAETLLAQIELATTYHASDVVRDIWNEIESRQPPSSASFHGAKSTARQGQNLRTLGEEEHVQRATYEQLRQEAEAVMRSWIGYLEEQSRWVAAEDGLSPRQPLDELVMLGSQLLLMTVRHRHLDLATRLFNVAMDWLDLTQVRAKHKPSTYVHLWAFLI